MHKVWLSKCFCSSVCLSVSQSVSRQSIHLRDNVSSKLGKAFRYFKLNANKNIIFLGCLRTWYVPIKQIVIFSYLLGYW